MIGINQKNTQKIKRSGTRNQTKYGINHTGAVPNPFQI